MSEKRYRQLKLKDREAIEEGLTNKKSISTIAREIGVSSATVSREIKRNRRDDGYKGNAKSWGNNNICLHRKSCELRHLCKHCTSPEARFCSFCKRGKCKDVCKSYEEEACERIKGSPHVCNGCHGGGGCRLRRWRYSAKDAQALSETRGREAREGLDVTEDDLMKSEAIIRAGLAQGQGLDHIYAAHKDELAFSKSSFYRHVRNGDVSIIALQLRKAVKYKVRNKNKDSKRSNIPAELLQGRMEADFRKLPEEERARVVECDSVEGPHTEDSALLTLHFKALHFQIAFKLKVKDSEHVMRCFEWLKEILGDSFTTYLGILKFDRGAEFARVVELEGDGKKKCCQVFFADVRHPEQKGSAEKNHVELRKVIKKGTSLKDIGPWELAAVMSHVNSSKRLSLFGKSPLELAMSVLPQELFCELGLKLIAPDDVVLLPRLLDEIKRPS